MSISPSMSSIVASSSSSSSSSSTSLPTIEAIANAAAASNVYFIDFEAFQHGKEETFQLKELCIVELAQPLEPFYQLFAPPQPWKHLREPVQRTYHYQTLNVHGLFWNDGVIPYCRTCLQENVRRFFPNWINGLFYVVGEQKYRFIKELFPFLRLCEFFLPPNTVMDPCPKFITCIFRGHGEHCAVRKCYRLMNYYLHLPQKNYN